MAAVTGAVIGGLSLANSVSQQRKAGKSVGGFTPTNFSSPGLSGTFANGRFSVTRSGATTEALRRAEAGFAERAEAATSAASGFAALRPRLQGLSASVSDFTAQGVQSLRSLAEQMAEVRGGLPGIAGELSGLRGNVAGLRGGVSGLRGELTALRGEVRPGFGRLTESRIAGLRDQQRRSVGNLREELSRRRVAGSSFATREISALESEFGRQEDFIRAESFLQELGATAALVGQEAGLFGQEAGLIDQEAGLLDQQTGLAALSAEMIAQEAGFVGDAAELNRMGTQMIADFLSAEGGLIAQEFAARADAARSSIEFALTTLDQLNLESNLAASIANASSQQISANLSAQAQARQASAQFGLEFADWVIGLGQTLDTGTSTASTGEG